MREEEIEVWSVDRVEGIGVLGIAFDKVISQ